MGRTLILALLIICSTSKAENGTSNPILCSDGSFRCADNSGCVTSEEMCDFNINCKDLSDERLSFCKIFHSIRGPCRETGKLFQFSHGCDLLHTICSRGLRSKQDAEFLRLCGEVQDGLMPNKDFLTKSQENSKLYESISALKKEPLKLEDVLEHLATSFTKNITAKNGSTCPPLYVNISGKCLALFSLVKMSWAEANLFCKSIKGKLDILGKMEDYLSLLEYLNGQGLTTDFWIGGHYSSTKSSETSGWKWLDENEITMGVPFWSLYQTPNCTTRGTSPECYSHSLAPRKNREGFCLALDYAFHYYFIDQNCHEKRSPLCLLKEK